MVVGDGALEAQKAHARLIKLLRSAKEDILRFLKIGQDQGGRCKGCTKKLDKRCTVFGIVTCQPRNDDPILLQVREHIWEASKQVLCGAFIVRYAGYGFGESRPVGKEGQNDNDCDAQRRRRIGP